MTLVLRHNREVVGDREAKTIAAATRYLGGVQPYHWLDFMNDDAIIAGRFVGGILDAPNLSFTRATAARYPNSDGSLLTFPSGALRNGGRGYLTEAASTNLFLNSAVGATQDVAVSTTAHTLTFYGTGTITLSGASTAGPLVGTGANNRVSLTFTPSAGTLTLSVSGSCTQVQLEATSFASSYIETAGASATRNADEFVISGFNQPYPATLWAEFERYSDAGAGETIVVVDDNNSNQDLASIRIQGGGVSSAVSIDGGAQQANPTISSGLALSTVYRMAGVFATNRVQVSAIGALGTEDVSAANPNNYTHIRLGLRQTGIVPARMFIRRVAIFDSALSDAQMQAMTS